MKKDTLLAHAGRDPEKCEGMVNMPVYRTSTVLFPTLGEYETRDPNDYKSVRYGRYGTPTTFALEEAVARMEGGHLAVAVPSGLAAVVAALSAFVKPATTFSSRMPSTGRPGSSANDGCVPTASTSNTTIR